MKIAEQVSVTITSGEFKGKTLLLDVEEFQPFEPAAYAWSVGWNCAVEVRGVTHWFFIDEVGQVWYNGTEDDLSKNEVVGICPVQEAEYAKYSTCGIGWSE